MRFGKTGFPVILRALAILVVGMSGAEISAQSFDLTKVQQDGVGIGKTLLGLIMIALTVVGAAEIVRGLAEARQKGGWGHFLWGVGMVMIAFFAFIAFLKMGGHNADQITQQFQIR